MLLMWRLLRLRLRESRSHPVNARRLRHYLPSGPPLGGLGVAGILESMGLLIGACKCVWTSGLQAELPLRRTFLATGTCYD